MHKLDILSTQIFSEIRLQFEENRKDYTKEFHTIFLSILWIAQEILKSLIYKPPWDRIADRPCVRELSWNDYKALLIETSQNTRWLLAQIPQSTRKEKSPARQPRKKRESIQRPPPSYTLEHDPPHDTDDRPRKSKVIRILVNRVRKLFKTKR